MSKIEIFSDVNNLNLWDDYVLHNPKSHFFHTSGWLKVLINQYKFSLYIFCYINDNDLISAGIPFLEVKTISNKKKWISLPFSDFCEPLYNSEDDLKKLIDFVLIEKEKQKINLVEIRYKLPFPSQFQSKSDFSVHYTSLFTTPEQLFKSFKTTQVQQPVTKAIRDGLISEIRNDYESVKEFYSLHLLTRRKLGVPVQPRKYFDCIYNEIILKNYGFIVLVKHNNNFISAGVFFGKGKILTYKYGASNPQFLLMRPNNLMIWAAMNEGIKRNFESFDFGKTELINSGLRKFKSGWGSKEDDLYYSYFPAVSESSSDTGFVSKLMKVIIKKSPLFICRLIGELFYKYAA